MTNRRCTWFLLIVMVTLTTDSLSAEVLEQRIVCLRSVLVRDGDEIVVHKRSLRI